MAKSRRGKAQSQGQLAFDFGELEQPAASSVGGAGERLQHPAQRRTGRGQHKEREPSPTMSRLIKLREAVGYGDLGLRWRRCTSWLEQAEQEIAEQRFDEAFVFCWIAFNAAYSVDTPEPRETFELESIRKYFALLRELDKDKSIERDLFDNDVRWQQIHEILGNKYIFAPFWRSQQDSSESAPWRKSLEKSKEKVLRSQVNRDILPILEEIFSRLYVLRNQLVHGAATYNGSLNRRQVEWSAAVMYLLLPTFLEIMFQNPDADWGTPKYPALNRKTG